MREERECEGSGVYIDGPGEFLEPHRNPLVTTGTENFFFVVYCDGWVRTLGSIDKVKPYAESPLALTYTRSSLAALAVFTASNTSCLHLSCESHENACNSDSSHGLSLAKRPSSLFDRRRFLSGIARGVYFLMGGFFFSPGKGGPPSELTNFRELVVVDGGQPSRLAIHTCTCSFLSTRRLWLVLVFCFLEENQPVYTSRASSSSGLPG